MKTNISFLMMSLLLALGVQAQSAEQTISDDFTPSLLLVVFGILLIAGIMILIRVYGKLVREKEEEIIKKHNL